MTICSYAQDDRFWPSSKAYLRHLSFSSNFKLKEITLTEIEHICNDIRREHLNFVIKEQNLVIVALSGKRDFVFGAGELFLNGERRQHSNTRQFVCPALELTSFVSRIMLLRPGDVIATGTPSGVGPMNVGDVVEVQVQGIGTLRNKVGCART